MCRDSHGSRAKNMLPRLSREPGKKHTAATLTGAGQKTCCRDSHGSRAKNIPPRLSREPGKKHAAATLTGAGQKTYCDLGLLSSKAPHKNLPRKTEICDSNLKLAFDSEKNMCLLRCAQVAKMQDLQKEKGCVGGI